MSLSTAAAAVVGLAHAGSAQPATSPIDGVASAPAADVRPDAVVKRWWSVPGAAQGSRVAVSDPGAVARTLHPSRTEYCSVLRQSVAAGRGLAASSAGDGAAIVATEAYTAEITALAPAPVHRAWELVGGALVALARANGDLSEVKGYDVRAVGIGSTTISRDAVSQCHVSLAATRTATS